MTPSNSTEPIDSINVHISGGLFNFSLHKNGKLVYPEWIIYSCRVKYVIELDALFERMRPCLDDDWLYTTVKKSGLRFDKTT